MNTVPPLIGVLICWFSYQAKANMAEPVSRGTLGARPFLNQYVDIIREDLVIVPDKDFKTAQIKVVYFIKSEKEGVGIPLLFYASEHQEDFTVRVDGRVVEVKMIPSEYKIKDGNRFKDFGYFFEYSERSGREEVVLEETPTSGFYISLTDMKYFETDLSEGEHTIEVTYASTKWTDGWDWVNEYSFRYALSPASYWKSFGQLNITVETDRFDGEIRTNLGTPASASDGALKWTFNGLPTEVLQIIYVPEISLLSKALLAVRPLGGAVIFGLCFAFLHFKMIKRARAKRPLMKTNWVVPVGSMAAPVVALAFWLVFIGWTKASLGEHAGTGIDPYSMFFVPVIFYPLLLIPYWLIMWRVDKGGFSPSPHCL